MDIYTLTATELHDGFIKGTFSAEEIVTQYLQRIEKYDSQVGAFITVYKDKAIDKAKRLDKKRANGEPLGKLAGVVVAIKDNMHIKGEITTCASKYLENYEAPFSASVIHFMENEDAIFIGKTNLDEFAMGSSNENSAFFPTNNPWNLERSAGGSSGGSSAAVAARFASISLGTDTGGSIRQPASFCGIPGFKPTYGRVSRYGLVAFGSSFDQIGPMAITIEDIALLMEVIGRHSKRDSTSLDLPPESFRDRLLNDFNGVSIGIPWNYLQDLSKDARENFDASVNVLKDLGAQIVDIDLKMMRYSIAAYYIIATAEASTNLARFDGIRYGLRSEKAKNLQQIYNFSRDEGLGTEVKKRIILGTYLLSAELNNAFYRKAQQVRTKIIEEFDLAFEQCDLIAMPTTPSIAFPKGSILDPIAMYLQDVFTISANLAGLPAISIPSGFDPNKMPLGLQLLGPQLQDSEVIGYAHAFEKATNYAIQMPPEFS